MSLQSPVKKIYITQPFGVNADDYARFGLQGHNGIDFRAFLPNGDRCSEAGKSEVFSPHDGVVRECAFDAGGYGNYIKIESETQGSVLAHFSSLPLLKLGQPIKQGAFIGYQGTTGNSTGIHLHWGWYPIPRNRSNGFNGYENQAGKYQPYKETGGSMTMYKGYDLDNKDSMKIAVDILVRVQNGEFIDKVVYEEITSDLAKERQKTLSLQKERSSLQESLAIKSRDLEEALEKIADLESQPIVPVDPDMDKWELNGLIVVEGNKRYNYKLKE